MLVFDPSGEDTLYWKLAREALCSWLCPPEQSFHHSHLARGQVWGGGCGEKQHFMFQM